jgi:hypothetical protein
MSQADLETKLDRCLHQEPDVRTWLEIQRLLLRMEGSSRLADAVDRAEQALERWPDELRTVGYDPEERTWDDWLSAILRRDESLPFVKLARTLAVDLGEVSAKASVERLQRHLSHLAIVAIPRLPATAVAERVLGALRRVETLLVENGKPAAKLLSLLASPTLAGLRALVVRGAPPAGALTLVLEARARLDRLEWSDGPLSTHDLSALASWPGLTGLRSLTLRANRLRKDAFAHWPAASMPSLRELELSHQDTGDEATALWLDRSAARNLERLALPGLGLGEATARAIARLQAGSLERLELAANGLDAAALTTILEAPWLDRLRVLDLTANQLGDDGADLLARHPRTAALDALHLAGNGITAKGRAAIQESSVASPALRAQVDGELAYELGSTR